MFFLYFRAKEHSKSLQVGGEHVDAAVTAVFAALVWHTQQLRDDFEKYGMFTSKFLWRM